MKIRIKIDCRSKDFLLNLLKDKSINLNSSDVDFLTDNKKLNDLTSKLLDGPARISLENNNPRLLGELFGGDTTSDQPESAHRFDPYDYSHANGVPDEILGANIVHGLAEANRGMTNSYANSHPNGVQAEQDYFGALGSSTRRTPQANNQVNDSSGNLNFPPGGFRWP